MIGFIGIGNMGGAIARAVIGNGFAKENELIICAKTDKHKSEFPASHFTNDASELKGKCEIIFLAVKPYLIEEVLTKYMDGADEDRSTTFISVAAGTTIDSIRKITGEGSSVIRVMPNTPVMVGKGISAISRGENVPDDIFEKVKEMFSSFGKVMLIDESKQNAVISLMSSSPAYLFLMCDAMSRGAELQGFSREEAVILSAAVFEGAAKMITESGKTPMELADMVTSPGGTTRAARDVFEKNGFEETVIEAMLACTRRAEELAKK